MDNLIASTNTQNSIETIGGIQISAIGKRISNDVSKLTRPRILKEFALVYLLDGSGNFSSSAHKSCTVTKGDAFFLFPGISHLYGPASGKSWREIWVLFSGEFVENLLHKQILQPSDPVYRKTFFHQRELDSCAQELVDYYHLFQLHQNPMITYT